MVILREMIAQKIISGFRHTIDFYYHDGVPCARRWPRSPGHKRTPAVMAGWPAFTYAAGEWNRLSPIVRHAYEQLATKSGLNGRDMQMRAYMTGLYRYPLE